LTTEAQEQPRSAETYDARNITVLEGLEAVRKRPGMYIGDVHDGSALHHLVWEAVDNAVDEHLAGFCDHFTVTVHFDGSITVEDNGRGIPVGIMEDRGVSAAEVVMTVLHAGGKFDHSSYKVSAGLHGVGVSAVNAVSEVLRLEIRREGKVWFQEYRRGVPQAPLAAIGESDETGTKVTFKPDHEIFSNLEYSYDILANRLRELAFLNSGLIVKLVDERAQGRSESYVYKGGIREFVALLAQAKEPVHEEVIAFTGEFPTGDGKGTAMVDLALQWTNSYAEQILPYTNNVHNKDGGTHLTGLRAALTRSLNAYGQANNLFKEAKNGLTGDDTREGVICVIHVKHPDASFDSQTKSKLVSSDVKGIVENAVSEHLGRYFEEHPQVARKILEKAVMAAKARDAARKAREVVRKGVLDGSSLSGKLADCQSKDPTISEIYIVEGESAGGSAKQGRDRHFQAILPLKGKILNVERARLDRMLSSQEVATLISALGCGIGDNGGFDLSKLRYHKIILMTDADVDGSHIRTLLLTFFYRQMRDVIENGYLFIAQPPLFGVRKGKKYQYLKDQPALDRFLIENGIEDLTVRATGTNLEVSGMPLFNLATRLRSMRNILAKIDRRCDARVVAALLRAKSMTLADFRNHATVEAAAQSLQKYLEERYPDLTPLSVAVEWEKAHDAGRLNVKFRPGASARSAVADWELAESAEYQELLSIEEDIRSIGPMPYTVRVGNGEPQTLPDPEALEAFISERGRKGMQITRYKGLGEMNADQLWDTTMSPDARTLLQVKVSDPVRADELFSVLMGDQVEPRRKFIEENALNVRNLDI
jgi:DNA gyrase subunit B